MYIINDYEPPNYLSNVHVQHLCTVYFIFMNILLEWKSKHFNMCTLHVISWVNYFNTMYKRIELVM